MRNKVLVKLICLLTLIVSIFSVAPAVNAQDVVDFADGEVDSIWQNLTPFYAADTGQFPDAEILAAYVTTDRDYLEWIYFRVDFVDPPQSTDFSIYLDCDENDSFDDFADRRIDFSFFDGDLIGFFRDNGTAESDAIFPLSEVIQLPDDSYAIEIGVDLKTWLAARNDDSAENYFLETCLGTSDTSNEDPEKLIGVLVGIDFSDETDEGYLEILSAVEINRLTISDGSHTIRGGWAGVGILIILTFAFFVWRRGTRYV